MHDILLNEYNGLLSKINEDKGGNSNYVLSHLNLNCEMRDYFRILKLLINTMISSR